MDVHSKTSGECLLGKRTTTFDHSVSFYQSASSLTTLLITTRSKGWIVEREIQGMHPPAALTFRKRYYFGPDLMFVLPLAGHGVEEAMEVVAWPTAPVVDEPMQAPDVLNSLSNVLVPAKSSVEMLVGFVSRARKRLFRTGL